MLTLLTLLSVSARAEEPVTAAPASVASPASPTAPVPATEPTVAPTETPVERRSFTLRDGQVLNAPARKITDGWELSIDGERFVLPDAVVAASGPPVLAPASGERPRDANRTRYFYAPSAFTLGHGRGYVSQKEVVFTSAAIGLSDYADIQVGTIAPTLFIEGGDARMLVAAVKVGIPVGEKLRIGAGLQTFNVAHESLTLPFIVGTVGTEDRHASLSVGSLGAGRETDERLTLYNLAGSLRVRDNLALVSENYVVTSQYADGVLLAPSGGVRFIGTAFSTDLGFFVPTGSMLSGEFVPIPWLDVTWNFDTGLARR